MRRAVELCKVDLLKNPTTPNLQTLDRKSLTGVQKSSLSECLPPTCETPRVRLEPPEISATTAPLTTWTSRGRLGPACVGAEGAGDENKLPGGVVPVR